MPSPAIVASLSSQVLNPQLTCPCCKETFRVELLEPHEVDALLGGPPWQKRSRLKESGELIPWAILRGNKYWLYLKKDVDEYMRRTSVSRTREDLKKDMPGADKLPDEAVLEIQRVIEATKRRLAKKFEIEAPEDDRTPDEGLVNEED